MKHFKEGEFACRCCGELPEAARNNVKALVDHVLDPLREAYGQPIRVNSGFRCPKHNQAVGGVANSQHLRGEAADIAPMGGGAAELQRLAALIRQHGRWDQLIIYPTFIHVSWKRIGTNRKQMINKK